MSDHAGRSILDSTAICIMATGGTIDKIYFDELSKFQVGEPSIGSILDEANIAVEYRIQSLFRKDSLDISKEDRNLLKKAVADAPEKLILVTHGTDTMIESAEALSSISDKVIVFTGSMEPASLRSSDAMFNIGSAFVALQLLSPGIYIAMNGRVLKAKNAKKDREKKQFVVCPEV